MAQDLDKLYEFIVKYEELLNSKQYSLLYKKLYTYLNMYDYYLIGEFTKMLNKIGENPLDGTDRVPECYMYGNDEVTELVIPDNIKVIGTLAFKDCESLRQITLSKNLNIIGYGAFYNCYALQKITIPDGVTNFLYKVFYGCSALKYVTLGNNIKEIYTETFDHCNSLRRIDVRMNSKDFLNALVQNSSYVNHSVIVHCLDKDIEIDI